MSQFSREMTGTSKKNVGVKAREETSKNCVNAAPSLR